MTCSLVNKSPVMLNICSNTLLIKNSIKETWKSKTRQYHWHLTSGLQCVLVSQVTYVVFPVQAANLHRVWPNSIHNMISLHFSFSSRASWRRRFHRNWNTTGVFTDGWWKSTLHWTHSIICSNLHTHKCRHNLHVSHS